MGIGKNIGSCLAYKYYFSTVIYCHPTVLPSVCVIEQYYHSNTCRVAVNGKVKSFNNFRTVIYCSILTLEKEGPAAIYHGIFMR